MVLTPEQMEKMREITGRNSVHNNSVNNDYDHTILSEDDIQRMDEITGLGRVDETPDLKTQIIYENSPYETATSEGMFVFGGALGLVLYFVIIVVMLYAEGINSKKLLKRTFICFLLFNALVALIYAISAYNEGAFGTFLISGIDLYFKYCIGFTVLSIVHFTFKKIFVRNNKNKVLKNNPPKVIKKGIMFMKMKEAVNNIPKDNYNLLNYIVILFLALAVFFDPEYGFYTFLRISVTTFCGWTIYKIYNREKESKLLLLFGGIAILFNPIVKITLEYNIWQIIDIMTFCILIWWSVFYNNKFNNIEEIAETIKRKAISEILDEIKNNKGV